MTDAPARMIPQATEDERRQRAVDKSLKALRAALGGIATARAKGGSHEH